MFQQIHDFINNCNGEQVRFSPDLCKAFTFFMLFTDIFYYKFVTIYKLMYFTDADLCHLLTDHLVEIKQPIRGIEILKKAIRKIQLFDSQLTSIHADLCQLCLLSKCMKPALEFLDTDVTGIGAEVKYYHFVCKTKPYVITTTNTNFYLVKFNIFTAWGQ